MTTLVIGPDQEKAIADLMELARANPLTREYLARMCQGFDPADPATRHPDAGTIPLHFTIDLPIGVRVTYTEEQQPIGMCRHLSVSIDKLEWVPAPPVVDELLSQFGFVGRTGAPELIIWPEHYASGRIAMNALEQIAVETAAA